MYTQFSFLVICIVAALKVDPIMRVTYTVATGDQASEELLSFSYEGEELGFSPILEDNSERCLSFSFNREYANNISVTMKHLYC